MVRNQRKRFLAILVSCALGVTLLTGLWLWENRWFGIGYLEKPRQIDGILIHSVQ